MTHTILLVEKSDDERNQLAVILQNAGFRVLTTENADDARVAVARSSADLAVVSNAHTDGVDTNLVQWLRGAAGANGMPILALSADASVPARLSALASGANDHVSWPFDTEHILGRIRNLLNRRDHLPSVAPLGFARRILVVDDSPTYANALLDELQKDGHDVALAETGAEALQYLERHRADLVILDVFLPDTNGVEVCRKIKASTRMSSVLVLILTGREKSAVRAEAAAAHADDFAVKSRDLETIRSKVRLMLVRNPNRTISSAQLPSVTNAVGSPQAPPSSNRMPVIAPVTESTPRSAAQNRFTATELGQNRPLQDTGLFTQIVKGTGLSELLARSTVESICRRLNLVPSELTTKDVPQVIEGLERTLHLFLPPNEAKERLRALNTLAR